MDMTPNDNFREYDEWWGIFQGWWAMVFLGVLAVSCLAFSGLQCIGWPTISSLSVCLIPILILSAYVLIFVKGRALSYPQDLLYEFMFSVQCWLYRSGLSHKPVPFELKARPPRRS